MRKLERAFEEIVDICFEEGNEELDKEIVEIQKKAAKDNSNEHITRIIEEIIELIPIFCDEFDKEKYNQIQEIFIEASDS